MDYDIENDSSANVIKSIHFHGFRFIIVCVCVSRRAKFVSNLAIDIWIIFLVLVFVLVLYKMLSYCSIHKHLCWKIFNENYCIGDLFDIFLFCLQRKHEIHTHCDKNKQLVRLAYGGGRARFTCVDIALTHRIISK